MSLRCAVRTPRNLTVRSALLAALALAASAGACSDIEQAEGAMEPHVLSPAPPNLPLPRLPPPPPPNPHHSPPTQLPQAGISASQACQTLPSVPSITERPSSHDRQDSDSPSSFDERRSRDRDESAYGVDRELPNFDNSGFDNSGYDNSDSDHTDFDSSDFDHSDHARPPPPPPPDE